MKNKNFNIHILLERENKDSHLTVHFNFFKKNQKIKIEKADDLLKILKKFISKKTNLIKPKFKVKFKGGVGLLNKRIAKAIIKTINTFY